MHKGHQCHMTACAAHIVVKKHQVNTVVVISFNVLRCQGDSLVHFSSRCYLCAREAHMRSSPSLGSLPTVALETVPMLV